jgi:hypothetical protein
MKLFLKKKKKKKDFYSLLGSHFFPIGLRFMQVMFIFCLIACVVVAQAWTYPFCTGPDNAACVRLTETGGPCTSGDVQFTETVAIDEVTNAPLTNASCIIGSLISLKLRTKFVAGSAQRYNFGVFVNGDRLGFSNPNASCLQCFQPVLNPLNNSASNLDGNVCGDLDKNEIVVYDFPATVVCDGSNGILTISACTTWSQSGGSCNGPSDALPGSPSKCSCASVPVGNVVLFGAIGLIQTTVTSGICFSRETEVIVADYVKNIGSVALTNVQVWAKNLGTISCTIPVMQVGETFVCNTIYPAAYVTVAASAGFLNHTVVITAGCSICVPPLPVTNSVIIPGAPYVSNLQTFPTTCNGGADGKFSFIINGGSAPFSVLVSPASGVDTLIGRNYSRTGLQQGLYVASVTDAKFCNVQQNVTIVQPIVIAKPSVSTLPQKCNTEGSFTISFSGGVSGRTFFVVMFNSSNAVVAGPTAVVSGSTIPFAPGTYTARIQDDQGCVSVLSNPFTIAAHGQLTLSLVSKADSKCNGGMGTANFTLSGTASTNTLTIYNGNNVVQTISPAPTSVFSLSSCRRLRCKADKYRVMRTEDRGI